MKKKARGTGKKAKKVIPTIKRKAALFLRSEEGKLAKGNAAVAATSLLLMGAALPDDSAPAEGLPQPDGTDGHPGDGLIVSGHEADPTHCSHASHGSHGSHGQW